jgi:hypothetical protein
MSGGIIRRLRYLSRSGASIELNPAERESNTQTDEFDSFLPLLKEKPTIPFDLVRDGIPTQSLIRRDLLPIRKILHDITVEIRIYIFQRDTFLRRRSRKVRDTNYDVSDMKADVLHQRPLFPLVNT